MDKPVVAQKSPMPVEVVAGKTYFWCSCGRSANQPFCDGSHKDTAFSPIPWKSEETGKKFFCCCKMTDGQPFCDGTHSKI
ncbi:MAG: CDGSH iron-sulfur domain-containing protein [Pseudomonadota bacterium]